MKLIDILREIGETTAKPYSLTIVDSSVYYVIYEFEAKKDDDKEGVKYRIIIGKNFKAEDPDYEDSEEEYDENELQFKVSFGVVDRGVADFEAEFKDVKNLFRVMATVVKATKIAIEDEEDDSGIPVTRIIIEPTKKDKGDTRRANLYKKFIENNMPSGSKVTEIGNGERIQIDLPTE